MTDEHLVGAYGVELFIGLEPVEMVLENIDAETLDGAGMLLLLVPVGTPNRLIEKIKNDAQTWLERRGKSIPIRVTGEYFAVI